MGAAATTLKNRQSVPFTRSPTPNTFSIKRKVWGAYIGEDIGRAKCLCCGNIDITQLSFHCAQVVAGDNHNIENLRPICGDCHEFLENCVSTPQQSQTELWDLKGYMFALGRKLPPPLRAA